MESQKNIQGLPLWTQGAMVAAIVIFVLILAGNNFFNLYMPRGVCMKGDPYLQALHFTGDLQTSASYIVIGVAAIVFFHDRLFIVYYMPKIAILTVFEPFPAVFFP